MTYRLFAPVGRFVVASTFLTACAASPPPPAPGAPAAPAAAAAPPASAAPPVPAVVSAAADWNAPPTNGSPGVDVPKLSGNELLENTDFAGSAYVPWTTSFTAPGAGDGYVKDGEFCIAVTNKGNDPWDAQMRHRKMIIKKGRVYSIKWTAHSTKPVQVKAKVGMAGPPYKEYWRDTVESRPPTRRRSSACSRWKRTRIRPRRWRSTSAGPTRA